jgi:hypothetical protein
MSGKVSVFCFHFLPFYANDDFIVRPLHEVPDATGVCCRTQKSEMPKMHFEFSRLLLGRCFAKGHEEGDKGSHSGAGEIFGSWSLVSFRFWTSFLYFANLFYYRAPFASEVEGACWIGDARSRTTKVTSEVGKVRGEDGEDGVIHGIGTLFECADLAGSVQQSERQRDWEGGIGGRDLGNLCLDW